MSLEEATSISNTETTFDAQLIKKLTNTEVELKKCVAYKKSVYVHFRKRKLLSLVFLNETLLVKLSKNLVSLFSEERHFHCR